MAPIGSLAPFVTGLTIQEVGGDFWGKQIQVGHLHHLLGFFADWIVIVFITILSITMEGENIFVIPFFHSHCSLWPILSQVFVCFLGRLQTKNTNNFPPPWRASTLQPFFLGLEACHLWRCLVSWPHWIIFAGSWRVVMAMVKICDQRLPNSWDQLVETFFLKPPKWMKMSLILVLLMVDFLVCIYRHIYIHMNLFLGLNLNSLQHHSNHRSG